MNGFTVKLCPTRPTHKMKTNACKYAAEQNIAEEEALKQGKEAKSKEFADKASALYAKA